VSLRRFSPVLLAALLAACATTPPPRETGLLPFWRITRADGSGGSAHLLGSMHVAKQALALDPAILRALESADEVALEVAPDELKPDALLELMVSLGRLPADRSLAQLVSPDTLKRVEQRVAGDDVPLAVWLQWEPWVVTLLLANEELASEGFSRESGVEPLVSASAAGARKPLHGLETMREQIERFDALPLATQELLLRDALIGERRDASIDVLEAAWRSGDLATIAREVFARPRGPDAAPYFEAIYFARNRGFADAIAKLVDAGGRWFVAVGAGHVVGEQAIPQLLEARGYRVERVPQTPRAAAAEEPKS
jgi:uncharacterized protein YbaP (TraB family)